MRLCAVRLGLATALVQYVPSMFDDVVVAVDVT